MFTNIVLSLTMYFVFDHKICCILFVVSGRPADVSNTIYTCIIYDMMYYICVHLHQDPADNKQQQQQQKSTTKSHISITK